MTHAPGQARRVIQFAALHAASSEHPIVGLQRTAGNQAVLCWLRSRSNDTAGPVEEAEQSGHGPPDGAVDSAAEERFLPEDPAPPSATTSLREDSASPPPRESPADPAAQASPEDPEHPSPRHWLPGAITGLIFATLLGLAWYAAALR